VSEPDQIKRIVVRTPTWVGDAVMSLPALRELRRMFPAAHITLACHPGTADIFADPKIKTWFEGLHPMGRLGEPEEIAEAAIYFVSDESRWTTGSILPIDGGLMAG